MLPAALYPQIPDLSMVSVPCLSFRSDVLRGILDMGALTGTAQMEENEQIAQKFEQIAGLLEGRGDNPYRVQAYRNAADTLRDLDRGVREIAEQEGLEGLERLPGIGRSLSRAILEFLSTGSMSVISQIKGRADAVDLLATLPGIGCDMAERIYEHLGVETLEELEMAARSGDLAEVPGFGPKRVRGIIDALAGRLGRRGRRAAAHEIEPPIDEILDVDREYREKAAANRLRTIAPKRFNPTGEAWLPVLNTRRDGRFYTALFSNTPRAHELGRTGDWVVIYYDGPEGGGQSTVITQRGGPLSGQRIVRGREKESADYYARRRKAA